MSRKEEPIQHTIKTHTIKTHTTYYQNPYNILSKPIKHTKRRSDQKEVKTNHRAKTNALINAPPGVKIRGKKEREDKDRRTCQ